LKFQNQISFARILIWLFTFKFTYHFFEFKLGYKDLSFYLQEGIYLAGVFITLFWYRRSQKKWMAQQKAS